jgi:hypothetical protein
LGESAIIVNAILVSPTTAAEYALDKLQAQIRALVWFLCFFLAAGNAFAQAPPAGTDGIRRLTTPIVLDGKMGDPGVEIGYRVRRF